MADRTTAVAIFDDRTQAQRAIEQLKRAGFTDQEIGVTAREAGDEAGDGRKETHAKEGAITGVAAGAGVGALWGLGILAGVLPAIGPAIAGGTLAAILSSAAAGAATAGLAGTLIGLGIPEEEAKYYEDEFRAGRVVVTVDARGHLQEAQSILMQNGGYDMRSASDPERGTVGRSELVIERHSVARHPASGLVGGDERVRRPLGEEQLEAEQTPVITDKTIGTRATEEDERGRPTRS